MNVCAKAKVGEKLYDFLLQFGTIGNNSIHHDRLVLSTFGEAKRTLKIRNAGTVLNLYLALTGIIYILCNFGIFNPRRIFLAVSTLGIVAIMENSEWYCKVGQELN